MDSQPFLQIDEQTLSLEQSFRLLKSAGGFQRMLTDILRQHILETELKHRLDLEVTDFQVDQALMDFRNQRGLATSEQFQDWLVQTCTNYEDFRETVHFGIRVQKLRQDVTQDDLDAHFETHHTDYDRLTLSRIVLDDPVQAEQLLSELQADPSQFASRAQQHSLSPDKTAGGFLGIVQRKSLPETLRKATMNAGAGDVLGVFTVENRYCLLYCQGFFPAILEDQLQQALQNQLFEQWLQMKAKKLNVQLLETP